LLKEEFHTLCEKLHDRSRAERFLRAWVWRAEAAEIPQLHKFV
jgi:hypothetical protein